MNSIGIDIGGTKIAGAVVDDLGAIHAERRVPTPAGDPAAIVDAVVQMVEELADGQDIAAVGAAAPGFIDAAQSVVYYAPNLAMRHEPFRDRSRARLGRPVVIENDANAAGWAEFRFGAGRLFSDMVMLTIGTGVGGAIVHDDRALPRRLRCRSRAGPHAARPRRSALRLRSARMHRAVRIGTRPPPHGRRGRRRRGDRALAREPSAIATGVSRASTSPPSSSRRIRAPSPPSAVSDGISARRAPSLSAILDPQIFVIGGGVAQAGELLLQPIREAYLSNLPARGYHPEPEFRIAELVNDAGVVGAADLARAHFVRPGDPEAFTPHPVAPSAPAE